MDVATQILWALIWIFIIAFVGIITFMFLLLSKYKHKITIRMDTATGKRLKKTRAKEIKGTSKWKFLFEKREVIAPPSECIEMDEKGRYHVDCYISRDGEISYRRDPWSFKDVPTNIKELREEQPEEYKKQLAAWKKLNHVIESNPLTPKQKSELIRQEQKRAEWKKNGVLNTLERIAPLVVMLVIFICLLVFYGSIAEPSLNMADKMASIQETQLEITKEQGKITNTLNNLIKGHQLIDGDDIQTELNKQNGVIDES